MAQDSSSKGSRTELAMGSGLEFSGAKDGQNWSTKGT